MEEALTELGKLIALREEVIKVWEEDGDGGEIQMKTPIAWQRVVRLAYAEKIQDLKRNADYLKAQIKKSYHRDHFIDAERYEAELSEVEYELKKINGGEL
jgi:hypothetical protein